MLDRLARFAVLVSVLTVAGHGLAQDVREEPPDSSKGAILEIVDSRAARLRAIDTFKSAGVIGENNRGLVEIVDQEELDGESKAEVERLVRAENADRETLYSTLVSGGDGDGDRETRLRALRERYAEIMRRDARPGEWIQLPDGTWKRKGVKS